MTGRLEVRRWQRLGTPLHAVALSSDGQYVAVGSETGPLLFNAAGEAILTHSMPELASPVRQVALSPAADRLYLGLRTGEVLCANLYHKENEFTLEDVRILHTTSNDLHTLAISTDDRRIALGHLSARLTLLASDGELRWRSQPNEVVNSMWSVAFDLTNENLYVASAGTGTNRLAVLNLADCQSPAAGYLEPDLRATALAVQRDGVVVVLLDSTYYDCEIVKYNPDLSQTLWKFSPAEMVTALATDAAQDARPADKTERLAVACGYEGRVILIDGSTGNVIAETVLRAGVNSLALAQGRILAAVTQDDSLALLQYVP